MAAKTKQQQASYIKKYQKQWNNWLEENDYPPSKRGMVYHHEDPSEFKFRIGSWICGHQITDKNIETLENELLKCVYIPWSEHIKLNYHI